MRWDKFTVMSQEAFQQAQSKAEEMQHQEIRPELSLIHISEPTRPY